MQSISIPVRQLVLETSAVGVDFDVGAHLAENVYYGLVALAVVHVHPGDSDYAGRTYNPGHDRIERRRPVQGDVRVETLPLAVAANAVTFEVVIAEFDAASFEPLEGDADPRFFAGVRHGDLAGRVCKRRGH